MAILFTKKQLEELKKIILRTEKDLKKALIKKGEVATDSAGDGWHSAEFMSAYVEEVGVRKRLSELKRLAVQAKIIEPEGKTEKVDIGNKVLIEYEDGSKEKIVLEGYLVKPKDGLASIYSPLGRVLKGAKERQTKTFKVEGKKKRIKILKIFLP